MRKIAMIAAAAALVSAPQLASAADLGGSMKDVPPPVLVTNWTGFYVGAGIGFGAVVDSYKFYDEMTLPTGMMLYTHDSWTTGGGGVLGTIQVGYDYQFAASRWLVGAFADYDWEHFGASRDYDYLTQTPPPANQIVNDNHHTSVVLQNQWNVGGRFGVLTSPETLLYVVLAYTQAQEKASLSGWYDRGRNLVNDLGGTGTLDGVTVGAGLETHLKDNWFLKLEYRFSQLSSDRAWDRLVPVMMGPAGMLNENMWGEVDADIHTARIVLSYKFGKQGYVEPMK
jgi:outer membrane immunogenic protein